MLYFRVFTVRSRNFRLTVHLLLNRTPRGVLMRVYVVVLVLALSLAFTMSFT